MEEAPRARGALPGPPGGPAGGKRPSLLDRFKIIARGPVKRGSSGTPPPGPATGEQQQQQWDQQAASGSRRGRPPLPLVPTRGASEESVGSNGSHGSGGRSGQGAYHTLAHLAIRHQMNLLSRSRSRNGNGGGSGRPPHVPHPTLTLQPAGAASSAPAVPPGSAPLGAVRASSSLLRWGDYDTASEDEGEGAADGDGAEDGSTISDNNVWDESSDEDGDEDGDGDAVGEMVPVDPAYDVTPKLSARTLALSVTPSRLAERRKGLHISVDDEEEVETGSVPGSVGLPEELVSGMGAGATAAAAGGPLDGSVGGTNTSSSVATINPALTPYGGAGGPCCDEAPDRKEDGAAASCALGFSGSGSLSSQGEAEDRIRGSAHAPAPHVCKNSPQLAGRSLGQPCQGPNGGGDFVFQPSPALQAARAVRGAGGSCSQTSSRPRTPVGSEGGGGGEDDELVGRLSDEAEAEGRVVYSSVGENFDLGGFTIGRGGLIRSPRNRRRRRPSLNAGDNFVVLARLGSGNSSAVHKALHVPTMRLVALKALPLYDAERRAQVMRELRILYSNLASIEGVRGPCIEPTIEEADDEEEAGVGEGERDDSGLAAVLATQASLDDAPASGEGDEKGRKESTVAGSEAAAAAASSVEAKEEDQDDGEAEPEGEVEHCPYIVSFFDAFADAKHGCLTLVVEYMNGGSLQDLVNRGGCANEDVLAHISYNVLRGLAYLHERKKIHRDIKPSNLLINSCGYVKIADFGVSRSLDQPGSDLMADTFIGTVGYMSPERITGQGYSFGADIWAFGLSILACALGAFPLEESTHEPEGGGYWGLVHAVCESPAPALPETFTPAFRSFVSLCLVKDPMERASSQELLNHPFIASRHHLHKDAHGRITEFPESLLDMKLGELDMICRVLALHLVTRQRQQQLQLQQQQQQQEPGQPQQNTVPDRATMVQRLAEELGLRRETVGDALEAAFEAIRQQETELAKGPGPMDEPEGRGQGQAQAGAEGGASAILDMEGPR